MDCYKSYFKKPPKEHLPKLNRSFFIPHKEKDKGKGRKKIKEFISSIYFINNIQINLFLIITKINKQTFYIFLFLFYFIFCLIYKDKS